MKADTADIGCLPFAAATLAAALAAACLSTLDGVGGLFLAVFVFALVIAGLHVLFLALPIFFMLERRIQISLPVVLAASTLIGALPASVLVLPSPEFPDDLLIVSVFGGCGLAGGIAFWLALRWQS